MKKIIVFTIFCLVLITGCGKNSEKSVLKNFEKKINDAKSYRIRGVLNITNNDEIYNYDVNVSYKKSENYKISLINKSNNHEQIILKNKDSVYVVTPSLNKSFKFQSDWPNNNSQIYLLKSLLDDIKNDKNRTFEVKNNLYIFTTSVNYPNNNKLSKQNIKIDKNYTLKEVEVLDEAGVIQMCMKFNEIDFNADFDNDYFELNKIIDNNVDKEKNIDSKDSDNSVDNESDNKNEKSITSGSIDDVIFPLYIPVGTTLTNQEKVSKVNGERVILTFDGEKPFLLIEETANVEKDFSVIPTYGEPFVMADSIGALTNNSLSWTSDGIEYYLVSDAMSQLELIEIANSISSIPTMK